jgi:hypothetical protein
MSTKDIHENHEPAPPLGLGSSERLEPGVCNCRMWCRTWVETQRGKYPPANHHPDCKAFKAERFTVLELDGTRCVMEPHEALAVVADEPGVYTVSTVMLARDQFDRMPEFQGF